jgi:hypothetical protein
VGNDFLGESLCQIADTGSEIEFNPINEGI